MQPFFYQVHKSKVEDETDDEDYGSEDEGGFYNTDNLLVPYKEQVFKISKGMIRIADSQCLPEAERQEEEARPHQGSQQVELDFVSQPDLNDEAPQSRQSLVEDQLQENI